MKKQEFLDELRRQINNLPYDEVEKTISYYDEIISDRMEEGELEEEIVESLGSPQNIARDLQANQPFSTIIKRQVENFKKRDSDNTALVILLIVFGFPIWFPIVTSGLSILASIFATLLGLIVALWAASIGIGVGGVAALIGSPIGFIGAGMPTGFFSIGIGIALIGASILAIIVSIFATKGIIKLIKMLVHAIKKLFVKGA
ncbi:MAG: DUF1700 domain-containing protein [Bacilli bacterium]|jgi:uncharacterized membrane protein